MSGKLRAGSVMIGLLVLLLLLNMLTAVSFTGVGSSSPVGETGGARVPLIHLSLDYYGDSETSLEVDQILLQRLGCRFNIFSNVLIGAVVAEAVCRQNGGLLSPDEAGNSPNPGIIAAFLHAGDGMK
jgi:hypothetical protein